MKMADDYVIDETTDKVNKNINGLRNKSDVARQIDARGMNKYKIVVTQGTTDIALGSQASKDRYMALLEGKVSDKKIKEDLIRFGRVMLRSRITMRLIVSDTRRGISGIAIL